ncbi:hypothetical protein QLX67_09395 [Balneolaceae bacterium ANBcel3]|nr:hypothetical protein [Balneolaceae bacterium ANBcel3]
MSSSFYRTAFLSLFCLMLLANVSGCRKTSHPPGILVDTEPVQLNLEEHKTARLDEFILTKKAEFHVKARVLSRKRYKTGREATISRYDFALGWGPMSDSSVLKDIRIRQRIRFYFWSTRNPPIALRDINLHSNNMHMVTTDRALNREMRRARTGDIVEFTGYLVDVRGDRGWRWTTSMNRTDIGAGACEIVYLETFRIVNR